MPSPAAVSRRSVSTALLATCAATVGILLFAVAIAASSLSLWLSYSELTRRGDRMANTVEALLARSGDDHARIALDSDPDILAAMSRRGADKPDVIYSDASEDRNAGMSDVLLFADRDEWTWNAVVVRAEAAGRVVTIAYDTTWAHRRALRQLLLYGLGAVLASIATLVALHVMFKRTMKPMQTLARRAVDLSRADYTSAIPGLDQPDEIGTMARAIESFRTILIEREHMREAAEDEVRRSSVKHSRIDDRVDAFRLAIGRSLQEVAGLSDQMQVAADSLASIANETTARAESAVAAIGRTTANVSTVAAASEDLSASIMDIERQVEQTRGIVVAATRSTAQTGNVIKGLYDKSEKIDEIIGLIQAIAAQTNLLSLNATIEAARAGESGRGFAVVAQEVKSLADQTTKASHHVAEHVKAIQEATSLAVSAIDTIDATMAQADHYSSLIADAVERQAVATAAISRNAADAAKGAGDAATTMKRLATAIGETDQSAAQVHQSATDVGLQAADLSTTIDAFLADTVTLREERRQPAAA